MSPNIQIVCLILFVIILLVYFVNALLCVILIAYGSMLYKNSIVAARRNNFYKSDYQLREKIAIAAAVAAITASNDTASKVFTPPPTAMVSAWQAVMRSDILKRQGRRR